MDLVDEQDRSFLLLKFGEQHLEAFLEIAPVLRPRQQGAEIEREHATLGDHFRHFAVDDALGEPFGDRRLADPGFPHQQRVVLAAAAEDLDDAFHLDVATHQRVDLPGPCQLVQIARKALQRRLGLALLALLRPAIPRLRVLRRLLGDAVCNVVQDVETRDRLLLQAVDGVALLFAEHGDQHVGAVHRLVAPGLHEEDRALDDHVEARGLLRLAVPVHLSRRYERRVGVDELFQVATEHAQVGTDIVQNIHCHPVVEEREQQVLGGDELVALLVGLLHHVLDGIHQLFT